MTALGIPVSVENDVNLAARAELAFGRGRRHRDFVYLSIGTGRRPGTGARRRAPHGRNGFGR